MGGGGREEKKKAGRHSLSHFPLPWEGQDFRDTILPFRFPGESEERGKKKEKGKKEGPSAVALPGQERPEREKKAACSFPAGKDLKKKKGKKRGKAPNSSPAARWGRAEKKEKEEKQHDEMPLSRWRGKKGMRGGGRRKKGRKKGSKEDLHLHLLSFGEKKRGVREKGGKLRYSLPLTAGKGTGKG